MVKKKLQEKLKIESKNPSKIKSIVQVTLSEWPRFCCGSESYLVPVYLEGRHTLHIFYVLTFVDMAEPDEGSTNKADSESEDECEVLEESPCGRWQKRREEVKLVDKKHTEISHTHTHTQTTTIY